MRRQLALAATILALAACDTGDGRQMKLPDDPLPATTTTTTVAPVGLEPQP